MSKYNTKEYNKAYYQRNREKFIAETRQRQKVINDQVVAMKMEKGCERCGYKKCVRALHYHHLRDKKFEIATMVAQGRSMIAIQEELEKCILLCSNCHNEIHDEEDNMNRSASGEAPSLSSSSDGIDTHTVYQYAGMV